MKNIRTFTGLLLLGAIFLTGSSCKKETTQVVNQVFSATYTIKPTDWSVNTTTGAANFNITLSVPEIDNTVVAHGGVVVYLSLDGGGTIWDAIPEEYQGISFNTVHSKGSVYIEGHYLDYSAIAAPSHTVLAKVVILDGAPL